MRKTIHGLVFTLILLTSIALGETHMVTLGGDHPANPQTGTLRHAVQVLAKAGDTVRFASPLAVTLEQNLHVTAAKAGLRIEGPGQVGFKRKPDVREGSFQAGLFIAADNVTIENLGFRNCFVFVGETVADPVDAFRMAGCTFVGVGGVGLQWTTGATVENNTWQVFNVSRGEPALNLFGTSGTTLRGNTVETRGGAAVLGLDEANFLAEENTFKRHVDLSLHSGSARKNQVERSRLSIAARLQDGPITVEENTCATLHISGVDLAVRNNVVQGNLSTTEDYRWPPAFADDEDPTPFTAMSVSAKQGAVAPHSGPIVVEGNQITGGKIGLLVVQHIATPATDVKSNTITGCKKQGIIVNATHPLNLESNTISECRGIGIQIVNGTPNVAVASNTLQKNGNRGIVVFPKAAAQLFGNAIDDHGREGIVLGAESDVHVEHNTVRRNKIAGVVVDAKSKAELDGNTITENAGPGVKVYAEAELTAENDTIQQNAGPGILLLRDARATVAAGVISNNLGAGITVGINASADITETSFGGNRGPGIDIAPPGVTPNKLAKRGNGDIDFPEDLTFDADTRMIRGRAEPGAGIELYRVEPGPRAGNPRNGEGVTFVGGAMATQNGEFAIPPGTCAPGDKFCLTATRFGPQPVTSEFSGDVECTPDPLIRRVNVASDGTEANNNVAGNETPLNVSADGRFVVFSTVASNLVTNDGNGNVDVFVRDNVMRSTTRVSVSTTGGDASFGGFSAASEHPGISADGRWIVYSSNASNIVANDENYYNYPDVFLYDRETGTNIAVTDPTVQDPPLPNESEVHFGGQEPAISADGNVVAFTTIDDYWAPGDTNNNQGDIYVWTRSTGAMERVSIGTNGEQIPGGVYHITGHPRLSANGQVVVFATSGTLHPGASSVNYKVYLRDRTTNVTELISQDANGNLVDGYAPSVSADGRFVAFSSAASLVAADTNGTHDVYVRDRQTGTLHWCSPRPGGGIFSDHIEGPFMSANGRYVTFFAPGDSSRPNEATFTHDDVYLHDRETGITVERSVGIAGDARGRADFPSLTPDGRFLLFRSGASNLVLGDTNNSADLFQLDLMQLEVTP